MILELSPLMQRAISNWRQLGHPLDVKLLSQCAYYPRAGCQHCSLSNPNQNCKRAHILTLTEMPDKFDEKELQSNFISRTSQEGSAIGGAYQTQTGSRTQKERKERKAWGQSLESLWNRLPLDIQSLITQALEEVK